jgi:hypothetical protein
MARCGVEYLRFSKIQRSYPLLEKPTHLVHTSPVTSPQFEQVCLLSSFSGSVIFARLLVLSLENFENDLSVLVLQDVERPIAASVRGDGVALQPSSVWSKGKY